MTSDSDIISTFTPAFKRIKTVSKPAYMIGSKRKITSNNTSNVQNNFESMHKSYAQMAKSNNTSYDDTPYQDLGDYKEESIFHWYKGEAHKKNLKKLCFGGSDYMIGCPWEQFGNDKHNGIKFITSQISDCASAVYNKFAKTTYFIFEEKEHAAKFLNTKYFHNGKSVELFGTIKYAEEDICAKVKKESSVLLPFGIQILLVKNENADIPNFIEIEDEIIGLFWKGCPKACNFCKKSDHWKSECPTIKAKEDLRKSKKNKNSKAKEAEPEDKADHEAEKNETTKIPGMIQPVLANENLAIPTANKVDAPITAAKHAILADSKNINDTAQTSIKPATDRKLAVPTDNLKEKNPTRAGKKIYLKGAIAAAISTNNISLESSDIDEDNAGKSENTNSSDIDIDSSDIEAKKEPNSSQEGYFTQDSGFNEYKKVYDDFRRGRIDKTA
ncbi:hypothetical protein AYI69_g4345, partial [Smittium culicis]